MSKKEKAPGRRPVACDLLIDDGADCPDRLKPNRRLLVQIKEMIWVRF